MALDSFNRPSGHINWTPLVTALQNLANSGGSSGGSSTVVRNTASANSATEAYSTEYLNGKITALETSDGTQNTAISALQTSDSNQNTKLDKFPLGQSPADDNKQLAWVSNSYQLVSPSSTTILDPTDPVNPPAGSPNEVYSTSYVNIVTNQVVANATNINTLTNNQPGGLAVQSSQIRLVNANGDALGNPVDLYSLNNVQTKDLLEYNAQAGNWVNSRAIQIDSVSAEQVSVRSADGITPSASFDFRQGTHGGTGNPGFVYSLPAINNLPPVGSVLQVGNLPSTTEAQLTWSTLSSGSSTFASLSDTAQYTSGDANKFVVLNNDGSSLVYTDTIKLDGAEIVLNGNIIPSGNGNVNLGDASQNKKIGTIDCNQLNAGDGVATSKLTHNNYNFLLPTLSAAPGAGDIMKVASVSGSDVTLEFSAAGISDSKKVDQLKLSGGNIIAEDGITTWSARGVLFGNRTATMFIDNTLFIARNYTPTYPYTDEMFMLNGIRVGGTGGWMEQYSYQVRRGGHIIMGTLDGLYVKLNAIHFFNNQLDTSNAEFKFYGSNNRADFDLLHTFNWNAGFFDGFSATTHTINGVQVTIPARGPNDIDGTYYVNTTQYTIGNSNPANCKRYVFDNTNFYRYYLLKFVNDPYSPNATIPTVSLNNMIEYEW